MSCERGERRHVGAYSQRAGQALRVTRAGAVEGGECRLSEPSLLLPVLRAQIPRSCELDWVKLCVDACGLQARSMDAPDHRAQRDIHRGGGAGDTRPNTLSLPLQHRASITIYL